MRARLKGGGTFLLLIDRFGDFCLLTTPALPRKGDRAQESLPIKACFLSRESFGVHHSRPGTIPHRASGSGGRATSTGAATWLQALSPLGYGQVP